MLELPGAGGTCWVWGKFYPSLSVEVGAEKARLPKAMESLATEPTF